MPATQNKSVRDRLAGIIRFYDLGLSVIPLQPRGKRPVVRWEKYQKRRVDQEKITQWFGNGRDYNVGFVCGEVSNVVVIDCDSAEANVWADAHLPQTPMMTRTAKGTHRYYRHPGVPVGNKVRIRTDDPRAHLDVRGDGGYVVAPGSIHPDGVAYEALGEWPDSTDGLPKFEPSWVASDPPFAPLSPDAQSVPPDRDQKLFRVRRYLESTPPAIQGQGGDAHTFQVACRVVRGFDLPVADARLVLGEWNQQCQPPWSARELDEKIANAQQYGDEPVGGRLGMNVGAAPVLTDVGNAEYFASRCGDRLRYDHQRGRWLVWVPPIWRPDEDATVVRLAIEAVRSRYQDAAGIDDLDLRRKAMTWARRSENRTRLDALRHLAQALPPLADVGQDWDVNPNLLACSNGVVDLKTGIQRPGRQADRLTMTTGVSYDETARCPRFLTFLNEVFAGHRDLINYMQRVIGYCLTGETSEQCWWLWYGSGANGKGTMIRALGAALGDYATGTPFATFLHQPQATLTNDLARLCGRRFVWAQEANQHSRLNEERIKTLTGGDEVTARFLHKEFFTFRPTVKLVLAVNHKPVIRDDSFGMWRRVRLVPFTQRFPIDKTLETTLAAEAPGILAWAVQGARQWHADGLKTPELVTDATRDYERDSDPLKEFLDTRCVIEPGAEAPFANLYTEYTEWAEFEKLMPRDKLSRTMLGRMLGERFKKGRTALGHSKYFGIRIVPKGCTQ